MDKQILFTSHSLEILAEKLSAQLLEDQADFFSPSWIVIPNPMMKEWLQRELCRYRENQVIVGLQFCSWKKALTSLLGSKLSCPRKTELAAAIWSFLKDKDASEKRKLEWTDRMVQQASENIDAGLSKDSKSEFLPELFQNHAWQTYPEALEGLNPKETGLLYLFAVDQIPPAIMRFFLRVSGLRIFQFSPCAMFWEDFRSNRERKAILHYWKKKNISSNRLMELETSLLNTQPLLANWGVVGRKIMQIVQEKDMECYENYELSGNSLLNRLKLDLLLTEHSKDLPSDRSIRGIRSPSSRLSEMKIVRDEILRIAQTGIPFSEIRIYAPDIESYVSSIEFHFSDPNQPIPFRIAGLELFRQSSFYQAVLLLFRCVNGRWEAEDLLSLFEMTAWIRKAHWTQENVDQLKDWIRTLKIRWGTDAAHRKEIVPFADSTMGTWEAGISEILDHLIYWEPRQEKIFSWNNADFFGSFCSLFDTLRGTLHSWRQQRTLQEWAKEIGEFIFSILYVDETNEADRIASRAFHQFLDSLQIATEKNEKYPFAFVEKFFFSFADADQGSSLLHGVRFHKLEYGTIVPTQVIFLIGMDEDSFPRASQSSGISTSHRADLDRYLFLQTIFAAKEQLIFSYPCLSKEDGKAISPSLLIQELASYCNIPFETRQDISPEPVSMPSFLQNLRPLSESVKNIQTISIQELNTFFKNPFRYYLKDILGIKLKEEPETAWSDFEISSLEKYRVLRSFLEGDEFLPQNPPGILGEVAALEQSYSKKEMQDALQEWEIDGRALRTITFKESCRISQIDEKSPLGIGPYRLIGEASLVLPTGVLFMGKDEIGNILRKWPELLVGMIATGSNRIYCLKTKRIREVKNPEKALESCIELYSQSRNSPLFLHPEWVDPWLRKNGEIPTPEDPILRWILDRSPGLDLEKQKEFWEDMLRSSFSELIDLYPTRKSNVEI